jgi:hypothetical protein
MRHLLASCIWPLCWPCGLSGLPVVLAVWALCPAGFPDESRVLGKDPLIRVFL